MANFKSTPSSSSSSRTSRSNALSQFKVSPQANTAWTSTANPGSATYKVAEEVVVGILYYVEADSAAVVVDNIEALSTTIVEDSTSVIAASLAVITDSTNSSQTYVSEDEDWIEFSNSASSSAIVSDEALPVTLPTTAPVN